MTRASQIRTYERDSSVVFRKTREAFGGLSNMAGGFPIDINGRRYRTSEVLYQACRYPHMPEIQELVVSQRSPMTAKMKSRPYRKDSRSDWDQVRVATMKWCLRAKLLQNWCDFSALLLETGERPIVEESGKDAFWGAKPKENGTLEGTNVLGRLLMELREKLKNDPESLRRIEPVPIRNFLLFDKPVPVLEGGNGHQQTNTGHTSADLFLSPPESKENKPATDIKESSNVTSTYKKKLIEVAIPLEAINAASAREKSIRHGHPSTLHLWWARRPLAACRAVLFAQLVDDPSSHPDKFPTEEAVEAERKRLFQIIEDLVKWENSTNESVLERARAEIRKSCDGELPPVYDPFSGGGSIPLEAQRLGLPAHGSDINPVAVMIGKAMIELPPKFKNQEPIHPGGRGRNHYRNAEGLAEDVRYYGEWLQSRAFEKIGTLYPKIDLPKYYGGGKATSIAWVWARTVPSPDPAFNGAPVPIASTFLLNSRQGKEAWVEPVVDKTSRKIEYIIKYGGTKEQINSAKNGTKLGRGANFQCILSGSAITPEYVKKAGKRGNLGNHLLSIIAEQGKNKVYLSPNQEHSEAAQVLPPVGISDLNLPNHPQYIGVLGYGFNKFSDLISARQQTALYTFSELLESVKLQVKKDAFKRFEGRKTEEFVNNYSKAVCVYLTCSISRAADFWNNCATWEPGGGFLAHLFTRQAIPMVWDYAEGNPFNSGTGGWSKTCLEWVARVIEGFVASEAGMISQSDAQNADIPQQSVISTDPPYYDNVPYADISDFFYIWLKGSLGSHYPDLFSTLSVPKMDELVADRVRHGGADKAEAFFVSGMLSAMIRMRERGSGEFPATIYYAFKQREIRAEGISSTGWATFLKAVIDAGYEVIRTWPARTERSARMRAIGSNALANSVVLVCRQRPLSAEKISRAEFIRALKRELPKEIEALQDANIAPSDMPQSAIGPGMGVFSRYAAVLESDDSDMDIKTVLQIINQELDSYLNDIQGEFDSETRFSITWFEQNGFAKGEFGIANSIAQARGISVKSIERAGIVENSPSKVRILKRDELLDDWEPASDTHLTIWKCCQYLVRALENEGEEAAALLIKKLGSDKAEAVKDLAYCLHDICSNKRNNAKEAAAYNALIAVWTDLTSMAATIHDVRGDSQTSLNL